jgi:hypothetical protein
MHQSFSKRKHIRNYFTINTTNLILLNLQTVDIFPQRKCFLLLCSIYLDFVAEVFVLNKELVCWKLSTSPNTYFTVKHDQSDTTQPGNVFDIFPQRNCFLLLLSMYLDFRKSYYDNKEVTFWTFSTTPKYIFLISKSLFLGIFLGIFVLICCKLHLFSI